MKMKFAVQPAARRCSPRRRRRRSGTPGHSVLSASADATPLAPVSAAGLHRGVMNFAGGRPGRSPTRCRPAKSERARARERHAGRSAWSLPANGVRRARPAARPVALTLPARGLRTGRQTRRSSGPARARRARQLRRPPHPLADVEHERGHQHGAHEERVQQHAEGDDEADLGEEHERQHAEHGERAGEHDARRGDHAARHGEAADHARPRAVVEGLLADPGHQEDVVVDAERDEEHEAYSGSDGSDAREAEDHVVDDHADAERRAEGQDHRPDQQQRREHRPQQQRSGSGTRSTSAIGTISSVSRVAASRVELDRGLAADEHVLAARLAPAARIGSIGSCGLSSTGRRQRRGEQHAAVALVGRAHGRPRRRLADAPGDGLRRRAVGHDDVGRDRVALREAWASSSCPSTDSTSPT